MYSLGTNLRLVPWTGMDEWRFVRDAIYGPAADSGGDTARGKDLELALLIGDVWRSRGKLPVAVDATLHLMRLLHSSSPPLERQLALSAALLRMVNELVDPGQRGQRALPINRLAEQIGLSRFLVDLRHESTHDALPGLDVLELGARMALDYLWSCYWEPFGTASLPSVLKDRVVSAIEQISNLAPIKEATLDETTLKTVGKILTTEVDHLDNRERLAALMAVLASPKWLGSAVFMAVEEALSRLKLLGRSVVELMLFLITEAVLPDSNKALPILTRLAPFADVDQEACQRILHALVQHPLPFAFSVGQLFFGSPTVVAKFPQHCSLFGNLLNAVQANARPNLGSVSIDLEQTLQLMEREAQQPARRGFVPDWRPLPLGCSPGYDPVRDGFWRLYQ
jgi:hypothetical protein